MIESDEPLVSGPEPVIRPRDQHCISRRDIDPDALKVLYRLVRRGYTAYLVGGGVRDLMLQRSPKDFDVSTDARPWDLKNLFRNCFLIGRRFRLAHIKYGDKVIETSTFRRPPENQPDPDDPDAELIQHDDNTFGTPQEDALRRDFTINGLFYDVETFSVIDYVGGLDDLDRRLVRCIGDPDVRFREDPVRMVRAVRFASRLGFEIETETYEAILRHAPEIEKASAPRLLEEIYRLFAFGSAAPAFRLLRTCGLMEVMLPELHAYLDGVEDETDCPLWTYLEGLDEGGLWIEEPTQPMQLAALFTPLILERCAVKGVGADGAALQRETEALFGPFSERLRVPRRVVHRFLRIVTSYHRFNPERKRRFSKTRFMAQEVFPEALSLFELIVQATGEGQDRLREWRDLYQDFVESAENRRGRGGDADDGEEDDDEVENGEDGAGLSRSAKRRRRRRRKKKPNRDGNPAEASTTDGNDGNDGDDGGGGGGTNRGHGSSGTKGAEEADTETIQRPGSPDSADDDEARGESGKDESASGADNDEEKPKKKRRRRRRSSRRKKSGQAQEAQDEGEKGEGEKGGPGVPDDGAETSTDKDPSGSAAASKKASSKKSSSSSSGDGGGSKPRGGGRRGRGSRKESTGDGGSGGSSASRIAASAAAQPSDPNQPLDQMAILRSAAKADAEGDEGNGTGDADGDGSAAGKKKTRRKGGAKSGAKASAKGADKAAAGDDESNDAGAAAATKPASTLEALEPADDPPHWMDEI